MLHESMWIPDGKTCTQCDGEIKDGDKLVMNNCPIHRLEFTHLGCASPEEQAAFKKLEMQSKAALN